VLCAGARSLASGLIGRIVERVRTRFPLIEIGITEKAFERQMRALQLEEADIGLGFPAPPEFPDLASRTIDYDAFEYVALAESHRLARRRRLSLADLADETFVGYRSDVAGEYTRRVYAAFARAGFTPAAVREYDHVFAVAAAVEAGQGWTLLHREGRSLAVRGTKVIPLTDFKLLMPHALVWRLDERRPVVFTVMEQIRHLVEGERGTREGREAREDEHPTPDSPTSSEFDGVQPSAVLELRHLRYFCSVVEAGSFGRAAEQLGLTQPSLSRQVAALERAVAVSLLDRVARGVSTTPAGESFFRSAKRIFDEVRMLAAEVQRARRGVIARCVVAGVPSPTARELLAALLRECDQDLHDVELVLADVPTPSQPAALRAGDVDLGVCHASPVDAEEERGIERSRLTDDSLSCALVPESSPLARRREVKLRDLSEIPFIFPDRAYQPALYDEVFDTFDQLEFQPRVDATYEGLRTIWTLVAEGQGWAMGFASQCDSPPAGTAAVRIKGFSIPSGLDLLTRTDEARSLVLDVADRLRRMARARS
jgi:DNA-binding transcriptional LysR family regulator